MKIPRFFTLLILFCILQPDSKATGVDEYNAAEAYYNTGSYERAFELYTKAAGKGNLEAIYSVGYCYCYGKGTSINLKEAENFFRYAADRGHVKAKQRLDSVLGKNDSAGGAQGGISKSNTKTPDTTTSSSENGLEKYKAAEAHYGTGNYKRAVELYFGAAKEGNLDAIYSLGCCYQWGHGVDVDLKKAAGCFKIAADKGHVESKQKLEKFESQVPSRQETAVPHQKIKEKTVVVFVHGMIFDKDEDGGLSGYDYWGDRKTHTGMIGLLIDKGWRYRGLIWNKMGTPRWDDSGSTGQSDGTIFYTVAFSGAANSDGFGGRVLELARSIESIKTRESVSRLTVVGHSAGGLVTRAYLQSPEYRHDINHLVTIATPHMGAILSDLASITKAFGKRADSMTTDSSLIKDLNENLKLPTDVRYTSLIARSYNQKVKTGAPRSEYLNHVKLSQSAYDEYPFVFKKGFDGATQVMSQNLSLTKAGKIYEEETQTPIVSVIIPGLPRDEWHSECLHSPTFTEVLASAISLSPFEAAKQFSSWNSLCNELALIDEKYTGVLDGSLSSWSIPKSFPITTSNIIEVDYLMNLKIGSKAYEQSTCCVYELDQFGRICAGRIYVPQEISENDLTSKPFYGAWGYMANHGAYYLLKVDSVEWGSVACNCGIKENDVLVAYNNAFLGFNSAGENPLLVELKKTVPSAFTGAKVEIVLCREGKFYRVNVPAGQILGVKLSNFVMKGQ